jgi:peptide/nickel transport system substrate-binding protein
MSGPTRPGQDRPEGHTRAQFLRSAALTSAAVLSSGGLLAACDDGEDGSTTSSSSQPADQKLRRGGTLKLGVAGGSAADTLSPYIALSSGDAVRQNALYESLTTLRGSEKTLEAKNLLAEELSANAAADEWTIRLRDGVEFHNGKTLDVDDLLHTFRTILDPKTGAYVSARFESFDLPASKKLDKRTLRLKLKKPLGILPDMLGSGSLEGIIPVGFDERKPVGTGPFKLVSFKPGDRTVLERFENYWGDQALLDRVEVVNLSEDTARLNALISGQVHMIENVAATQVATLESNSALVVQSVPCAQFSPVYVRMDKAPFDDVRVRQALRLAINREQIIQQALGGQAIVAYDVPTAFDPSADEELVREQDIEQAKSLLSQAGRSGLSAEFVVAPQRAGMIETCTTMVEQWSQAGMNITLRQVDLGTLFGTTTSVGRSPSTTGPGSRISSPWRPQTDRAPWSTPRTRTSPSSTGSRARRGQRSTWTSEPSSLARCRGSSSSRAATSSRRSRTTRRRGPRTSGASSRTT